MGYFYYRVGHTARRDAAIWIIWQSNRNAIANRPRGALLVRALQWLVGFRVAILHAIGGTMIPLFVVSIMTRFFVTRSWSIWG